MKEVRRLADSGKVKILSLDQLEKAKKTKCYPGENNFIFTDDDGWIDLYTNLYPIARKYSIPFTVGVITSKLTDKDFVNALEVLEMSQNSLFSIAAHSVYHQDQSRLTPQEETKEVCDSKEILETLTKKPVTTYIFPAGRMSKNSGSILHKCGYTLGLSTGYGTSWNESKGNLDINRIRITPETSQILFEKLLRRY